jgi:hypothetical protein
MKLVSIKINKELRELSKDFWSGWTPNYKFEDGYIPEGIMWSIMDDFSRRIKDVLENYLK